MYAPIDITRRTAEILADLPPHVTLVAAAKTQSLAAVQAAVRGGVRVIGHNYVREAEAMRNPLGPDVEMHMIGHLQKNKASKAVDLFDVVETLDSLPLAEKLDRRCDKEEKRLAVFIEVNSAEEPHKTGVLPDDLEPFIHRLAHCPNLRVTGLMTMGPAVEPEAIRPFFRRTKMQFDRLRDLGLPHVDLEHLSMGMSDTFKEAIEEGATLIRLGTALFGPRGS